MNTSPTTFFKVALALSCGFVALDAAACNAILGNDDATLADAGAAAITSDGSFGNPPGTVTGDVDASGGQTGDNGGDAMVPSGDGQMDSGGEVDSGPIVTTMPGNDARMLSCGANQALCSGECVGANDPIFGCGAAGCAPCNIPRGTAACNGGECILAACNPGYADCNQDPSDGCETDLSSPSHCGACNAVCATAAPNCAPVGASFECTNGCSGSASTLCGKQCVNLATSMNHCGSCSNACPTVSNGKSSCAMSTCEFTCNPGFHACGASCASSSSVNSCGTSCTACAIPANALPTCAAGACGFLCFPGFGDCDKDASERLRSEAPGRRVPRPASATDGFGHRNDGRVRIDGRHDRLTR